MTVRATKVFISWSGALSKEVATVMRDLLPHIFDGVDPFMSEEDIGAGERGLAKISDELADTSFGIVVVTQANQQTQWLNFEAGALSKNVHNNARVAPLLVDFPMKSDATGPLAQFQANLLNRDGVERILIAIAQVVGQPALNTVRDRFDLYWRDEYEERFARAKEHSAAVPQHRPEREILDELLTIVRRLPLREESSLDDRLRFAMPLDIPLQEIRTLVASFPELAGLPVVLTGTEKGTPMVVFELDGLPRDRWSTTIPLGEALTDIGVACSFRVGYQDVSGRAG